MEMKKDKKNSQEAAWTVKSKISLTNTGLFSLMHLE
jgi:hypothetical protein